MHTNDNDSFGVDLKNKFSTFGPWHIGLSAFAETLPYEDNKVFLDETEKDEWGIPLLVMSADYKENEQKMRGDMKNNAAELFEKAGYKYIKTYDEIRGFGRCIHEMGTARMGNSPKDSILNKNIYNETYTYSINDQTALDYDETIYNRKTNRVIGHNDQFQIQILLHDNVTFIIYIYIFIYI